MAEETETEYYQQLKQWLDETKDEPVETMAAFFDRRIDEYQDHMKPWQRHYQWLADSLPARCADVLDIGCGSGLELAAIYAGHSDIKITGIDLSEKMLARLALTYPDRPLVLIQDDYFKHDFTANGFDAVIAFETLHHFSAAVKTALFAKIFRWLKKGGLFLECDYIALSPRIEDLLFAQAALRRKRDGIADDVFIHFDTPLTLDHEMQAIAAGGFRDVKSLGFLSGDDHTVLIQAKK